MINFWKKKSRNVKESYSQCGEDLIVDFIFSCASSNKRTGKYIDIGANHPTYLNNTYLFYQRNWTGINIDPIKENISLFKGKRPKDINICCGIGEKTEQKEFYVMEPSTLSTYDKHVVNNYLSLGHSTNRIENVNFLSVSDLITTFNIDNEIDLLTIDIEGNELLIINNLLNYGIRPKVVICETVEYTPELKKAKKKSKVIDEISTLGYILYADTFINSIFVSREFWK